jgi:muramoyltetrapeptide carboxypeptidase
MSNEATSSMVSTVLLPSSLMPGDTIGVVAPASNVKKEFLQAGVVELQRLGYQVKYFDHILAKSRYTAGTLTRRGDELKAMFADPTVKAIFAARGGYGSGYLLPHLDELVGNCPPKIFMGYSDITMLLVALYQKYGWVTFHGPMVAKDFAGGAQHYDLRSFAKALTRPLPAGPLDCRQTTVLVPGNARGRLLGGCLPIIVSLIGTPWELDTRDAILFLEDSDTKPFKIDRLLWQLRLAGKLDSVRGIVFSEMPNTLQHPQQGYTLPEMLYDLTQDLGVPVLYGLPAGHLEIGNLTLPLGVEAALDCNRGVLSITAASVQLGAEWKGD